MIMRYLLFSFLLLAGAASARELRLEQALCLAEEHSRALKEAEATRQAAEKSISAAKAERFPTLSLEATARYVDEVPSLDIKLPGLGSLSRDFGSNESYQTDLRLSIPLYTGGRLSSAIALAGSTRDYRTAMATIARDQLYLQTRLDYLGLHRAAALDRAAQAGLRRAEIIQDDIRANYDAGAADSVDLLDARLAFTKAEFLVRQARINVKAQTIRLLSRLGLAAGEPLVPADTLPEPPETLLKSASVTARPELEAAESIVRLNQARLKNERAAFFPTLAAYGGYSYGKPNIDPFRNEWNDNFSVGAQLQWSFNLGGSAMSRNRAASFDLEAARRHHDDVAESLSRESDLAYEQLRLAHEQYLTSHTEHRIASANYAFARVQYQNGALTSNRLLEIEAALSQAEASLAAAGVDFYIAQSAYYYAIADEKLGKGI